MKETEFVIKINKLFDVKNSLNDLKDYFIIK